MPLYEYQCSECKGNWEEQQKMVNREVPFTLPCPKCGKTGCVSQAFLTAPSIGDPVRLGLTKTPKGFQEVLSKIKEKHPRNNIRK